MAVLLKMILLQRITNSQRYIPLIDGFRFLAIIPVLLNHFTIAYDKKISPIMSTAFYSDYHIKQLFGNSNYCVLLFFAISGFILALPFATSYFTQTVQPNIKDYYLRRLTRLEPPYLIVLTGIFILHVFVLHKSSLAHIFPHYAASFFYVHDIIFHRHASLNFVFWSLEIELQFYLLAPFIARLFAWGPLLRRTVIIVLIIAGVLFNNCITFPFVSLINYLHYFLAGFLAADIYLSYKNIHAKSYFFDVTSVLLLAIIWLGYLSYGNLFLPFVLAGFILASFASKIWYKFLQLKWITIIGGMCYSLYILHHPITAFFVNRFHTDSLLTTSVSTDYILRLCITLLFVMVCCAIFFVLIERPTMRKDWYKRMYSTLCSKNNL
ncbi:MAG TPA: acyltransferase [Cytophagaceae bacterium]|jgi:peptidoglycan/LPS O-acetylase OafA/YrhL|nr:acyltransferase [Cytophagaceae bacterium]